jgi:hypothetical protein
MTITPHQQPMPRDSSQYGTPISIRIRVVLVLLAVLVMAGFGLASSLTPSKNGRGTHQQLGLPPCSILSLTNTPCPTCGMTTSFSHFVRGEWADAARANTSGFLLACCCLLYLPWSVASAVSGHFWLIRRMDLVIAGLLPGWLIVVFLEWGWRYYFPL